MGAPKERRTRGAEVRPEEKVSAKTKWWLCVNCAFANHPRANAAPQYRSIDGEPGKFQLVDGDTLCEQCGASRELEGTQDYAPAHF